MVLFSCKEEIHKTFILKKGEYVSLAENWASVTSFTINDRFYKYYNGSCKGVQIDSGCYEIKYDTIKVQSDIINFVIIKDKKIIIHYIYNGFYENLYLKNTANNNYDELDKNGNGETYKIDSLCRKTEIGEFKNFKLYTGIKIKYYNKGLEQFKTEYLKNGKIDTSKN